MDKFGMLNWSGAANFARGAYYAGRNAIFSDGTLSDLGKKAAVSRLSKKLAADVWEQDVYADYTAQKSAMAKLLEMHMLTKPKAAQPTAEQLMLIEYNHKQIMTKLALADNPVAVLKDVAANGEPNERQALLVNFGAIMDKVLGKATGSEGKAAGAELWGATDKGLQPGGKANQTAQQVQLADTLKGIYNATAASLKTDKEIKWEAELDRLVDEDKTVDASYNMAQRIFSKMWSEEFKESLTAKTDRIILDPWDIEQQAKQEEEEFIAAAKRAGNISGVGNYPAYR